MVRRFPPTLRARQIAPENVFIFVAQQQLCFSNKAIFSHNRAHSRYADFYRTDSWFILLDTKWIVAASGAVIER